MKYIKTFESLQNQNEPQVDDYVVVIRDIDYGDDSSKHKEYKDYISNNVGQVIKKNIKYLSVFYENIPEEFKFWHTNINIGKLGNSKILKVKDVEYKNVAFFSKNKEECEIFIASKKFNI